MTDELRHAPGCDRASRLRQLGEPYAEGEEIERWKSTAPDGTLVNVVRCNECGRHRGTRVDDGDAG